MGQWVPLGADMWSWMGLRVRPCMDWWSMRFPIEKEKVVVRMDGM